VRDGMVVLPRARVSTPSALSRSVSFTRWYLGRHEPRARAARVLRGDAWLFPRRRGGAARIRPWCLAVGQGRRSCQWSEPPAATASLRLGGGGLGVRRFFSRTVGCTGSLLADTPTIAARSAIACTRTSMCVMRNAGRRSGRRGRATSEPRLSLPEPVSPKPARACCPGPGRSG